LNKIKDNNRMKPTTNNYAVKYLSRVPLQAFFCEHYAQVVVAYAERYIGNIY